MSKDLFALVIGGTGMLEKVCHFLAIEGYDVYVVHRDKTRFQAMQSRSTHPDKLFSIRVDYHDEKTLQKKIQETIQIKGCCPDIIVSWIHNSAPNALPTILKEVSVRKKPWKLIHVQGSSSFFVKENTTVPEVCEYRRVYLGFVLENENARWLTHEEIANGIIKVIHGDYKETVIGTLKPWNKRPS
ncbi:short-chain dehydrogenase [Ornithinibacillus sp. 179-J 7C1 HS]|uniref:short-chain dehydrogenase n=1 Tax=Ornithinibacillus sp. 179-J 7C1 HS TaxID=3142384 RepID=UPI0039A2B062